MKGRGYCLSMCSNAPCPCVLHTPIIPYFFLDIRDPAPPAANTPPPSSFPQVGLATDLAGGSVLDASITNERDYGSVEEA